MSCSKIKIAAKHSYAAYFIDADNMPTTKFCFSYKHVQGYITKEILEKEEILVVSFTGTNDIFDWFDNLTYFKLESGIHQGWWNAYCSVSEQIDKIISDYHFTTNQPLKTLPVIATGHSAGGCLAAVFSWFYRQKFAIDLITFGSPKFSDIAISKELAQLVNYIRVMHLLDPIAYLPLGNFGHYEAKKVIKFWFHNPHSMKHYLKSA